MSASSQRPQTLKAFYGFLKHYLSQNGFTVNPSREAEAPEGCEAALRFLVFWSDCDGLISLVDTGRTIKVDLNAIQSQDLKDCLQLHLQDLEDEWAIFEANQAKKSKQRDFIKQVKTMATQDAPESDQLEETICLACYGDAHFFGPIVYAGVHCPPLMSEDAILDTIEQCSHSIVTVGNRSLNNLMDQLNHLSHLHAWGYRRVIENVLRQSSPKFAVVPSHCSVNLIQVSLISQGEDIQVYDRDESAVLAKGVSIASRLAKKAYLNAMMQLQAHYQFIFPKGPESEITAQRDAFVEAHGEKSLNFVAKMF